MTRPSMSEQPPDVVLLAEEWRTRALIRAQLIEEGYEVVATDSWPMMRRHLRPGMKPRLAIVDLKDLPGPGDVLNDLRVLMKPERVLVLTAIGTIAPADVERLGFRARARPFAVADVVRAAANVIGTDQVSESALQN
jgi:ActR/RegA family two-component response regulator